ncbi:hypothetical protein AB0P21_38845 [Kribbella sp. NPDC056861]|uniref:hypothetical protein n=1 Tax=Kribbella sp. NPDC056861 TaxID=3154857 RepID=UPI003437A55D
MPELPFLIEIVLGFAVIGGLLAAVAWIRGRVADRRQRSDELATIRDLANEDITQYGEELSLLGRELDGAQLDDATRIAYQRALEAYEYSQAVVAGLQEAAEVTRISDTLATGRYSLACLRAQATGRPLPELRPPCFFNPHHGPSIKDVIWNQPFRGTRKIPACAQDIARLTNGEEPNLRIVVIDGRRQAYWDAGRVALPYARGYFPGAHTSDTLRKGALSTQYRQINSIGL